jgi:hypothetical protein
MMEPQPLDMALKAVKRALAQNFRSPKARATSNCALPALDSKRGCGAGGRRRRDERSSGRGGAHRAGAHPSSSSSAFASFKSSVSKPSVNQPYIGARRSRPSARRPWSRRKRGPEPDLRVHSSLANRFAEAGPTKIHTILDQARGPVLRYRLNLEYNSMIEAGSRNTVQGLENSARRGYAGFGRDRTFEE